MLCKSDSRGLTDALQYAEYSIMLTVPQIIDELGGAATLAAKLGLPLGTVSAWKTRASIPSERWVAIVSQAASAGKEGITLEALAELAARPASRSSSTEAA